jgi:hypothetical protein
LTAAVNIAVFTAFACRIGGALLADADFKRFAACANVTFRFMGGNNGKIAARNGNEVATDGTVGGKNGKVWWVRGHVHDARGAVACGSRWRV